MLKDRFVRQFCEDAGVMNVSLQEMFPMDWSSRPVLANALYNSCRITSSGLGLMKVLATRDVIAVEQMVPFGDISLKMVF